MGSEIDIVYTWVDGTDPKFQSELLKHFECSSPPQASISPQRFRDNQELRYSLRSIDAFAPWFHRIYLVTNGQVPHWLDHANDRISVVTHDMIFPDKSDLPTFNSTAIEINLHRITGLSKKFLYLNDDCFLGRATSVNDFVTPRGQFLFFQNIRLARNMKEGRVHDRAYAYTQNIAENLWSKELPRLLPAHGPQLYDKGVIAQLETLMPEEFRKTSSHRFRAPDDLVLRVLYSIFMLEHPSQRSLNKYKLLEAGTRDYGYLELRNDPLKMFYKLWTMRLPKPKFFCINDDLGDVPPNHKVLAYHHRFLASYYPKRSSFERDL